MPFYNYVIIRWSTNRYTWVVPYFHYCEKYCCEYSRTNFCVNICFQFSWVYIKFFVHVRGIWILLLLGEMFYMCLSCAVGLQYSSISLLPFCQVVLPIIESGVAQPPIIIFKLCLTSILFRPHIFVALLGECTFIIAKYSWWVYPIIIM